MSEANLMKDEIDELLKTNNINQRHSYFQLKYFLIGKEPTLQSKMWQCLRELKTRSESLKNIVLENDDLKDKIEILDISVKRILYDMKNHKISDEFLAELFLKESEIKVRQAERQKNSLEISIKELAERERGIKEECKFFLEVFKNLEKIEPIKHFDDLESQKEYWHEKLSQKINLKILTQGSIDSEIVETIIALPDDVKIKQQTLQTLNLKQNEQLQKITDTAKKFETRNIEAQVDKGN
jgi:hypothetical protein